MDDRLKELTGDLDEATDRLNVAIARLEKYLHDSRAFVRTEIALGEGSLVWSRPRDGHGWALLYVTGDTVNKLANASREVRLRAVTAFPALLREVQEKVEGMTEELTCACDNIEAVLDTLAAPEED